MSVTGSILIEIELLLMLSTVRIVVSGGLTVCKKNHALVRISGVKVMVRHTLGKTNENVFFYIVQH